MNHDDCKRMLSRLGFEFGVSPNLISTSLLSNYDKKLVLNGDITYQVLKIYVELWIKAGVPNYASGSSMPVDWQYARNLEKWRK